MFVSFFSSFQHQKMDDGEKKDEFEDLAHFTEPELQDKIEDLQHRACIQAYFSGGGWIKDEQFQLFRDQAVKLARDRGEQEDNRAILCYNIRFLECAVAICVPGPNAVHREYLESLLS